ncbi:MAG: ATP-binding cassette domain-containing protein [Deltaproteobacteria bacterium]|jgi:energy-coupling factor transport system ATP-binding protein|nr:ATP-binding cassette domain-containing protein [Deltaproteobacteria bacterium]
MLKVQSLSFTHASSQLPALTEANFELQPGQALMVTGPSGGGKSTLLSLLAGLAPGFLKGTMTGQILLEGRAPQNPADWAASVGLMTQNPESQFLAGSVSDELYLTLRCRGRTGPEASERVKERLATFKLESIADQSVFKLSEGQKQKVVLAALTALKPKVLLLDEPSANLDPQALVSLADILTLLLAEGLSLVIADHRLAWLRKVCGQVLVLNSGRTVYQGSWEPLEDNRFRDSLGLRAVTIPNQVTLPPAPSGAGPGVWADNLTFGYHKQPPVLKDLSVRVDYGQVTAVVGPSGRGKTTLARLLCGLEKPQQGAIYFDKADPHQAYGTVVLQNTDHQLYMPSALAEVALALNPGQRKIKSPESALEILRSYGLESLADRHPQSLSGGEKQRLAVAVGLARPGKLLVLDEPTSGLDGLNLKLMSQQITRAAENQTAVMVITHDPELVSLAADSIFELKAVEEQSIEAYNGPVNMLSSSKSEDRNFTVGP